MQKQAIIEISEGIKYYIFRVSHAKPDNCSYMVFAPNTSIALRKSELSTVKDVKVIAGEECIQQHRLLVGVLDVKDRHRKCRKKPVSRCQVQRLKDVNVQSQFFNEKQSTLAERGVGSVEEVWKRFKNGLLETADKVCGRTKGRPKHRGCGMTKL